MITPMAITLISSSSGNSVPFASTAGIPPMAAHVMAPRAPDMANSNAALTLEIGCCSAYTYFGSVSRDHKKRIRRITPDTISMIQSAHQ